MFQTFLIQPIYNGFIFLIGVMPHGDVGLAIIAVTLVIRIVFYPAFAASIRTQMGMQAVQADVDDINKQFKDNPDERAKRTMALFKEHKVRPLAGFVSLAVQIPVFIALYYAFFREDLPHIAVHLLYPFVHAPTEVTTVFLGFVNLLTPHNIILALIVAGLQYLVTYISLMRMGGQKNNLAPERASAQKMQQSMMLYMLPLFIGGISYTLPAAVGLYFATGNVVSIAQEWFIRRQLLAKQLLVKKG